MKEKGSKVYNGYLKVEGYGNYFQKSSRVMQKQLTYDEINK